MTVSASECAQIFASIPFLGALTDEDCAHLAPLLERRHFVAGTTLFYEDDASNSAYFVLSGALEVFKSDEDGKKLPLLILREGGVLGEIGLLTGDERSATARALTTLEAFELPRETFDCALAQPQTPQYDAILKLSLAFARILARRLAATNAKLFECFDLEDARHFMQSIGEENGKLMARV